MTAEPPLPFPSWRPLFRADWRRFVFVHFALPPDDLAPHTPFELDCRDGRTFVSLVFFRLERMRLDRVLSGRIGRALFRPASDHWFLNVRTYVKGPAGPGIQFLVEWVNNPISLRLGPWLYGLPYRLAKFEVGAGGGTTELIATDRTTRERISVSLRRGGGTAREVAPDSREEFLLEKYVAYTHRQGCSRFFRIDHPAWQVRGVDIARIDDTLIRRVCPWFENAELISAQESAGFGGVAMGPPRVLPAETVSFSEREAFRIQPRPASGEAAGLRT